MSRRIFFCLLAASALITLPTIADAYVVRFGHHAGGSGSWHGARHGFPGHGRGAHGRGFRNAAAALALPWEWPGYAFRYGASEYPVFGVGHRDGYRHDCQCGPYGYHPFGVYGYWPNGGYVSNRSDRTYVIAPSAKIISIKQDD